MSREKVSGSIALRAFSALSQVDLDYISAVIDPCAMDGRSRAAAKIPDEDNSITIPVKLSLSSAYCDAAALNQLFKPGPPTKNNDTGYTSSYNADINATPAYFTYAGYSQGAVLATHFPNTYPKIRMVACGLRAFVYGGVSGQFPRGYMFAGITQKHLWTGASRTPTNTIIADIDQDTPYNWDEGLVVRAPASILNATWHTIDASYNSTTTLYDMPIIWTRQIGGMYVMFQVNSFFEIQVTENNYTAPQPQTSPHSNFYKEINTILSSDHFPLIQRQREVMSFKNWIIETAKFGNDYIKSSQDPAHKAICSIAEKADDKLF